MPSDMPSYTPSYMPLSCGQGNASSSQKSFQLVKRWGGRPSRGIRGTGSGPPLSPCLPLPRGSQRQLHQPAGCWLLHPCAISRRPYFTRVTHDQCLALRTSHSALRTPHSLAIALPDAKAPPPSARTEANMSQSLAPSRGHPLTSRFMKFMRFTCTVVYK